MTNYCVFLFKDSSLDIHDKYHPDIDRITDIEYDGNDGLKIGDISQDEPFALKIASRHWENMKSKIFSETYEPTAEDKISLVRDEAIFIKLFSDENPYKKILVKRIS